MPQVCVHARQRDGPRHSSCTVQGENCARSTSSHHLPMPEARDVLMLSCTHLRTAFCRCLCSRTTLAPSRAPLKPGPGRPVRISARDIGESGTHYIPPCHNLSPDSWHTHQTRAGAHALLLCHRSYLGSRERSRQQNLSCPGVFGHWLPLPRSSCLRSHDLAPYGSPQTQHPHQARCPRAAHQPLRVMPRRRQSRVPPPTRELFF